MSSSSSSNIGNNPSILFSVSEILMVLRDISLALVKLHNSSIVHRYEGSRVPSRALFDLLVSYHISYSDVKPDNILLRIPPHLKVEDVLDNVDQPGIKSVLSDLGRFYFCRTFIFNSIQLFIFNR
jgi:serine/threonine protein kinase